MAKSAWLPSLSLNTNFSRRQAASTAGFTVPARNSANPNLTLSYTLWDFGLRAAKVDAARAQEWVAGFTQNQNIQTVAFSVAQAYYQLLGNQSLVLADEKTVAENQKNLEAAEVLHRAGQATIGALYQARAPWRRRSPPSPRNARPCAAAKGCWPAPWASVRRPP
jgi:outer membrane protein TolC